MTLLLLAYFFLYILGGKLDGEVYYRVLPEEDSSLEVSSPREPPQSPILLNPPPSRKELDKTARRKVIYCH